MIRDGVLCMLLGLACGSAFAAQPSASLRLLLGTAPPWLYFDEACRPAGIGVDLFGAIAQRSGVAVSFVYIPFEEERKALLDGRLDGDINEPDPWFDQHLIRIAPVLAVDEVLIGDARGTDQGRAPRRIGHVTTHNSRNQALRGMQARILEFDSYASLIEAYLDGKVDAVAGIKETLLFHLYRQGATPSILRTLRPLRSLNVWLYVSPTVSAEDRARLAAAIDAQALDPVLARARAMHLGAHRQRSPRTPADCVPAPPAR